MAKEKKVTKVSKKAFLIDVGTDGKYGTVTNKFPDTRAENQREGEPTPETKLDYLYHKESFKDEKVAELFSCSIPENRADAVIVYAETREELDALINPTIKPLS